MNIKFWKELIHLLSSYHITYNLYTIASYHITHYHIIKSLNVTSFIYFIHLWHKLNSITDPSADRFKSLLTCAYAVRCSLRCRSLLLVFRKVGRHLSFSRIGLFIWWWEVVGEHGFFNLKVFAGVDGLDVGTDVSGRLIAVCGMQFHR
jgi:hypothetical protein